MKKKKQIMIAFKIEYILWCFTYLTNLTVVSLFARAKTIIRFILFFIEKDPVPDSYFNYELVLSQVNVLFFHHAYSICFLFQFLNLKVDLVILYENKKLIQKNQNEK